MNHSMVNYSVCNPPKRKKVFDLLQMDTHVNVALHKDIFVSSPSQRYTYRVLQTIQVKLILLCVWAEQAVLGSAKTALKFKYEI